MDQQDYNKLDALAESLVLAIRDLVEVQKETNRLITALLEAQAKPFGVINPPGHDENQWVASIGYVFCPQHDQEFGGHHARACFRFVEGAKPNSDKPYYIGAPIETQDCRCSIDDDHAEVSSHHIDCPCYLPF